jgi:hypothetical protein
MICLRYDEVVIVVMRPSFTVSSNKQVACKTQTLYKEVFLICSSSFSKIVIEL